MLTTITKHWKLMALKGVLLILFAIFAFLKPTVLATSLVIWFGVLIIISGVINLIVTITTRNDRQNNWPFLIEGILSILFGLLLVMGPKITEYIISIAIAVWFIFIGLVQVLGGFSLRKEVKGEGWMIVSGFLAVVFGVMIFMNPVLGIGSLVYLIGFAALIAGIAMVSLAMKFKKGKVAFEKFKETAQSRFEDE